MPSEVPESVPEDPQLANAGKVQNEYGADAIQVLEGHFKSDESQVLDHFKYLIRTFFYYDRLTVSLQNENELNLVIKLVDGIEDEFVKDTEFPSHGTLHGLPTVSGEVILSQN